MLNLNNSYFGDFPAKNNKMNDFNVKKNDKIVLFAAQEVAFSTQLVASFLVYWDRLKVNVKH